MKKLREIAACIAVEAPKYPNRIDYADSTARAEFVFGTFKVSCPACHESVRDMAERIAKGFKRKTQYPSQPMSMRPSRAELAAIMSRIENDDDITHEGALPWVGEISA